MSFEFGGIKMGLGATNIWVPAGDRIFVAPSLILHYIDAHGYRPPDAFIDAVRQCPPQRSPEYEKAMFTAGFPER